MHIPNISREEANTFFNDLMEVSCSIMNAVIEDLKTWKQEKSLKKNAEETAKLLTQQNGWSSEIKARYLLRAFFYLPFSYRKIFNLNIPLDVNNNKAIPPKNSNPNVDLLPKNWQDLFFKEDTLQNKWRQMYNTLVSRLYNEVDYKILNETDPRFTNWLSFHNDETEKFEISPDTLPT